MNDINAWNQWVWGSSCVLIILALCLRGWKVRGRIAQHETTIEKWTLILILGQFIGVFYFRRAGVVDFTWLVISSFGIAGYMSYRSLRLIFFKEKEPEAN